MTRRKLHISAWCMMALAGIACLFMLVGVAYARYREDTLFNFQMGLRAPAQVYLQAGSDPEVYTGEPAHWTDKGTCYELAFMLTNTKTAGQKAPQADQSCTLQLVASLQVWDGESDMVISLDYTQYDPAEAEDEEAEDTTQAEQVVAQITRIRPNTKIHREFGDGWLITFADNQGQELSWELPGEEKSTVFMHLTLETDQQIDTGLIQLLLTGQMTS